MTNKDPRADDERPVTLRIVELIDCVAANAPDAGGRPISMITLAHLGEIEQPLALSYDDTKRLVTKLLESLSHHGNEYATKILDRYFCGPSKMPLDDDEAGDGDGDEDGEAWKRPDDA